MPHLSTMNSNVLCRFEAVKNCLFKSLQLFTQIFVQPCCCYWWCEVEYKGIVTTRDTILVSSFNCPPGCCGILVFSLILYTNSQQVMSVYVSCSWGRWISWAETKSVNAMQGLPLGRCERKQSFLYLISELLLPTASVSRTTGTRSEIPSSSFASPLGLCSFQCFSVGPLPSALSRKSAQWA